MKIFKIILILALLISVSFGVCGDTLTSGTDSVSLGTTDTQIVWSTTDSNNLELTDYYYHGDGTYWYHTDYHYEADTLQEWFEDLPLYRKVAIYNYIEGK